MKKKIISLFVVLLLIGIIGAAKTINIDTQVEINNEVNDWWEDKLNNTNVTVEDMIVEKGTEGIEKEALSDFRNNLEDKCYRLIRTNNITKIEKGIDDLTNILEGG